METWFELKPVVMPIPHERLGAHTVMQRVYMLRQTYVYYEPVTVNCLKPTAFFYGRVCQS